MDKIKECIDSYEEINNKDYIIRLKNGNELIVKFRDGNFHHLIGFSKLKDKPLLRITKKKSSKDIYKDLKSGAIQVNIFDSLYYKQIEDRIKFLKNLKELFQEKFIIDFDKNKVYQTKLKSQKIVFKVIGDKYIHLFLVKKGAFYYPETFIVHPNNYYVRGQKFIRIKSIRVANIETTKKIKNRKRLKTNKKIAVTKI